MADDDIHDSPTPTTSTPRASIPKPKAKAAKPKAAGRKCVTHTKDGAAEIELPAPSDAPKPAASTKTADRNVRAVKPKS